MKEGLSYHQARRLIERLQREENNLRQAARVMFQNPKLQIDASLILGQASGLGEAWALLEKELEETP